ncbi:MAG: hypothetical protein ACRC2S_00960 [Waterburya sp.]
MKLINWLMGLLPICSYLGIGLLAPPAVAQCVQADVSVQYNISGSKEPSDRTNDVDFQTNGACRGNASVTTGVQGNVGGNGKVRQTRIVRHRVNNETGSSSYSDDSTVQIQSNPAIDVYNAADSLDN